MEFAIDFGGEPQDVAVTAWGIADPAGLTRLHTGLTSDPRYRAGLLILADYSGLDMSDLTDRDIERVAAAIAESDWESPPRAVAIVASNLPTFVPTRMMVAHLGGSLSHHRVFTSREAAVAWLREQRWPEPRRSMG